MITDRIGLHSVLLPLLNTIKITNRNSLYFQILMIALQTRVRMEEPASTEWLCTTALVEQDLTGPTAKTVSTRIF